MKTPTLYTDHMDVSKNELYHQMAVATAEIRQLIRLAGTDGIRFARLAWQDAVAMEETQAAS